MHRALPPTLLFLSALAMTFTSAAARAQAAARDYPTRVIRIVMPFPPGGTTDVQGRILAEKLTARLGQTVVLESRPGANGIIGMEAAARAPADGYTLVIATSGNLAVHPHLYKLPYDTEKDFVPVILVGETPGVLVVHPGLAAKTVQEFIALARRSPVVLTYGSSGSGGFAHISAELFASMTNIKMTHVPYRGSAQSLTDLVAGHIQSSFNITAPSIPHIQSGRVRALAVTSAKRVPALPDLPTMAEAGVPGYENSTWSGIGAPAGTPQPIIERLNREFMAALQLADVQERFATEGSIVLGSTSAQFRDYLRLEIAKYGKLIREVGIKAEEGGKR
ncbi:MAG: tripartite tricarboxylate transporter substrate binding protein [Betaproteobacteria bacterium]|nr:tripartite tricarboxylate transporter substrate binding protein [Betaproteobacteria bacterium]